MRADFAIVFAAVLAGPAFAQGAPAPGSGEAIPEKDPSAEHSKSVGSGQINERRSSAGGARDSNEAVIEPSPGSDPVTVKPAPVPHPHSTPAIPPPDGGAAK
jgi:hypothetical protein